MNLTISNIITISVYLITVGIFVGTVKSHFNYLSLQISNLEKKVDKHNGMVERMYKCEESVKSAHHRIDEMRRNNA